MVSKNKIFLELLESLKKENAFWSYNLKNLETISDDVLIEKVLIHLDIDDIIKLYNLYPKNKILKIWKEKLLPQKYKYHNLNRFYAFWLFEIKNPDKYINDYLKKNKI